MRKRAVWFIPRPERDPKFHRDALLALAEATGNFKVKWEGNRSAHIAYERKLAERGLKRNSTSCDGSGGRTWAAMLRAFSYCYLDDEGYIVPTKAGRKIMEGIKVFENIKKQILTFQIPNAYFLEAGFRPKFEESFAIRPARFLIKLCCRPDLDFNLTKEEITFFVLTAKRDSDLDAVAEQIRAFRSASSGEREALKRDIAAIFDHRERSDRGARDFEAAHSDVAHTFMLLCEYTGLVRYARRRALRVDPSQAGRVLEEIAWYDERYPFNRRYLISLQRMAESSGLDVDSYKAGSCGSIKPASNRRKTEMKIRQLLQDVPAPAEMPYEELVEVLRRELPPHEAEEAAQRIKNAAPLSHLSDAFVESYLSEADSLAFENKTGEILKALGFDVVMRPEAQGSPSRIEILVKYGGGRCGLIDCKNHRDKFTLSSSAASMMYGEYIPNYDGYENCRVEFFGYVTASSFGGEKNLEKISRRAEMHMQGRKIRGIMLNARTLLGFLDYCLEAGIPRDERVELFLRAVKNRGYSTAEEMLREVGLR
ncbi:restriction endonuclease AlwI [Desulfovirgula thermocuniculi]|uniref:restriction endonuclease AlwI n=1 Tax=Desulfovirgula thermocuniculi TaxID=348842 RepID=UPI0003FC4BAA|nr:restriction endonuclease AlwI [Desulfovirgula thermocuniculi]